MDDMKKFLKKYKARIFIITALLFIVPILIVHLLFKWYWGIDFLVAKWSAGDMLNFIGSFLSFVGTVLLGALALWQNQKANEINKNLLNLEQQKDKGILLEMHFSYMEEVGKMFDPKQVLGDFDRKHSNIEIFFALNNMKASALKIRRRLLIIDQKNIKNDYFTYTSDIMQGMLDIVADHINDTHDVGSELIGYMSKNNEEFNKKSIKYVFDIHKSIFKEETKND